MTVEELTVKVSILQEASDKMRKRIIFLEDRLDKVDGIKKVRPSIHVDNGFPIA